MRVVVSRQNAVSGDRSILHYAVTDAAPGVLAECRERIFEKFFRVEHHQEVDATERQDTDLVLYLCKHIIIAHGGHIWCDAGAHGIGTRIALTLPGEG